VCLSTLLHVAMILIGASVLVLGLTHLVSPTSNIPLSAAIFFVAVGIVALLQSMCFLFLPARRVLLVDGAFSFISPRRRLEVKPGELRSIRPIWPDPCRVLPVRVSALRGSILLWPRFPDLDDLLTLIESHSPNAEITSLEPVWDRPRVPRSDEVSPGRDQEPW